MLFVLSLAFVAFGASAQTASSSKHRSIFGEPQQDADWTRRLSEDGSDDAGQAAAAGGGNLLTRQSSTAAVQGVVKLEVTKNAEAQDQVVVHIREGGELHTEVRMLNAKADVIDDAIDRHTCDACDHVAVDKNGNWWKCIAAASMTTATDTFNVPTRKQNMVMSRNGDFVVFFYEHWDAFDVFTVGSVEKVGYRLSAAPLPGVSFRSKDNKVWLALANGNVVQLDPSCTWPMAPIVYWPLKESRAIAAFRVNPANTQLAFVNALNQGTISVCDHSGDCKKMCGPAVADFMWHDDNQILCRTLTGTMLVWNVAKNLYAVCDGVEDVCAFTCARERAIIAHSDGNLEVIRVPDINWAVDGTGSVERSTTRRVAYFARHPQDESRLKSFGNLGGLIPFCTPNTQVTEVNGMSELRELRDEMVALTVDDASDKQAYDELHDAANVYVATSPLVRAVWGATYALDGICQGQIAENYTVYIHGALQETGWMAADVLGPKQTDEGVKAAALKDFSDSVDGEGNKMLNQVTFNEKYNIKTEYSGVQLLTEVRDSPQAQDKVLFATGHSQWFQNLLADARVTLDAECQALRDDLDGGPQSGHLYHCQVLRFEYAVDDGKVQMWDCRTVFMPETKTL